MRTRKKNWTETELNTNKKLISNPEIYKGKWNTYFENDNPIHIELGCGKGHFITSMSKLNCNINYIAIERQSQIIAQALKKERNLQCSNNIAFFITDIKSICNYFDSGEIKRIYINFCDPWPNRKKWAKRRLTHENFIKLYENILGDKGEVFFKTDNKELFEFSLNQFSDKNWKLHNISLDLHNSDFEGNIMTEYEQKFSEKGMPIYRLEAFYDKKRNTLF